MKRIYFLIIILILLTGCGSFNQKKQIADEISEKIEDMVKQIPKDVIKTADDSFELFQNPEKYADGLFPNAQYEFYDDVMYHNPADKGNGKFLYSGYYPVGEAEKKKVKVLEHIIPSLKWLIHESEYSEYIIQSYLTTYDTLIVFYPYADLVSFIPPKKNIQNKGISIENNPEKSYKWTAPYVDIAGKGFIIDLIYPVYNQDFMEAFIGVDITISTLKKKLFDGIDEKMLLIDKNTAQIMIISDYAAQLLSVENIAAFKYLEMIENYEMARPAMPDNLILTKTGSPHMKELWSKIEDTETFFISIDGKKHQIYRKIISNPQWYLVIIE